MREENIAISKPILNAKAEGFSKKLRIENFSYWLIRKERHSIFSRIISGESESVVNNHGMEKNIIFV